MLLSTDYKQRISSNPNGVDWSKDETKYGQKMLEKMGWKKGKGLGANEDGITNHLKVSQKNDKKGFGCVEAHTDKWLDRLDEYEAILAQLNGTSDSSLQDKPSQKDDRFEPLSKKSEGTRNRVHYSKFTKGKDLSLQSKTDLDCIFGGKREKHKKDGVVTELAPEQNPPEANEAKQFGVVTTTSSTNLQDYFAQKMASLRRSRSDTQLGDEKHQAEDGSRPESLEIGDCNAVTVSPLKKKKKRAKMPESAASSELVELAENVDGADKSSDDPPIGKAKKRKKKKQKDLDQSNSDDGAVVTPGDSNETAVESSKKRKRKRKDVREIEDDFHSDRSVEDEGVAVPDSTVDECRRKKRKKCVNADKIDDDDDEPSRTSDIVRPKKKKRTKS